MTALDLAPGLVHFPGFLDRGAQERLRLQVDEVIRLAPPFVPAMPRTGKPFSVRMSNAGLLGWVSDREKGYRYQATHPHTGAPWPAIPPLALDAWKDLSGFPHPPEACLINLYDQAARMGLHQDRDEQELSAPVLSLSLGDAALFRFGIGEGRSPTRSIRLQSGDALVMGGAARLAFHGIDRLYSGSSTLLPGGGRINLTLRRVTRPGRALA
jgi:DNA oxidative demethylase